MQLKHEASERVHPDKHIHVGFLQSNPTARDMNNMRNVAKTMVDGYFLSLRKNIEMQFKTMVNYVLTDSWIGDAQKKSANGEYLMSKIEDAIVTTKPCMFARKTSDITALQAIIRIASQVNPHILNYEITAFLINNCNNLELWNTARTLLRSTSMEK